MRKIRRKIGLFLGLVLLLETGNVRAGEIDWERSFVFTTLPSELEPGWKLLGSPSFEVIDDSLTVRSTTDGGAYWVWSMEDGGWDATQPTTVEFRLKAVSTDGGAEAPAMIVIKSGKSLFSVKLPETPDFKTYRIVLEHNQALLFDMDAGGDPVMISDLGLPDAEVGTDASNSIGFGDYSEVVGGVSQWKFLRWTSNGAHTP